MMKWVINACILLIICQMHGCTPKEERAEQYLKNGLEQVKLGDHEKAIRLYTRAIELKPDFAMAYTFRGSARYDLKDYEGAMKDYTKSIEIDPYYADPYDYRGRIKAIYLDVEGACEDFRRAEALGKPGMQERTKSCP